MAINQQPDNLSTLGVNKHRLIIERIPTVNYFCQAVPLPGITLGTVTIATSYYVDYDEASDKIRYDDLDITFSVDEDLKNYQELTTWIKHNALYSQAKYGVPPSHKKDRIYSDAILMLLTNKKNANIRVRFKRCYPYKLGTLNFDTRSGDDQGPIEVTASFKYVEYEFLE